MKKIEEVYESTVVEKDEHRKSKLYKKLSPKLKDAVDDIFTQMDAKPSDFLNTFEKTISDISKKYKVPEKELMRYFEKEMEDERRGGGKCRKRYFACKHGLASVTYSKCTPVSSCIVFENQSEWSSTRMGALH